MVRGRYRRQDRRIEQKSKDVYLERSKIQEPSLCPNCHALYLNGRWTWEKPKTTCHESICPACRRIADNYPAGVIELGGPFYREHKDEVINLILNVEAQEKNQHALERIMKTQNRTGVTIITTTGIHLARRIGEALSRSFKGNFRFNYLDADRGIRVTWHR